MKTSLFVFRRDLRLEDNLALVEAAKVSDQIIPAFFFDPVQLRPHPYRSENGLQFMFNSLSELETEIENLGSKLLFFHGSCAELLPEVIKDLKIDAVFCSKDYTPFSRARDILLEDICRHSQVEFHSLANILLNEPEEVKSGSGTPYSIFTPFSRASAKRVVPEPKFFSADKLWRVGQKVTVPLYSVNQARERYQHSENPNLLVKGGRKEALRLLKKVKDSSNYKETRDFPALHSTTGLSAHNKFGTISIREFYHAVFSEFGAQHTLCLEMYWRDFFTHVAFHFPRVFSSAFNLKYDKVAWEENDQFLDAWQTGQTGFPIVDAGMRELNCTGFMHNRVRMIVASFLTKDLLLDWHHGERYFARKLVDYDPAVNNGNWQWAASTGCDAQPYFRIFNPWTQSEKFDKDAVYIKKWVPELKTLTAKQIHKLNECQNLRPGNYPAPLVEHSEQRVKAQRLFEAVK